MKSPEEMTKSVLQRREDIIINRNARRKKLAKTLSATLPCLILVIATLFAASRLVSPDKSGGGELNDGWDMNESFPPLDGTAAGSLSPPESTPNGNLSTDGGPQDTDGPTVNGPDSVDTPCCGYIYSYHKCHKNSPFSYLINGKLISCNLNSQLKEYGENELIGIEVRSVLDPYSVCDGKTLITYRSELDTEKEYLKKLITLLKRGDQLKLGDELFFEENKHLFQPARPIWSREFYERMTEYIGNELLNKYIVNGVFLKQQLELDIAEYEINTPFTAEEKYYDACAKYYKRREEELIRFFEDNGISYKKLPLLGDLTIEMKVCDFIALQDTELSHCYFDIIR